MKGLLLKEWMIYKSWLLGSTIMGIGGVLILPIILGRYLITEVPIQEIRLVLMFLMLGFSIVNHLVQFNNSLNTDHGKKDMWLHNPHSMHILIGAKFMFSLAIYFVGNIVITSTGIYFMSDVLLGSFTNLLILQLLLLVIMLFVGIFVSIIWLFFWTIYLEGKYWVGKFSLIATVVVFILIISFLPKLFGFLSIDKLLNQGEISLEFLEGYLPIITISNFIVELDSIYIVEELFYWIIFVLLFWAICKWLERVITR
ncbi:hypothetical protein [Psychrobacillus sp. NPDC096623]|uniref:hypothetical protein n=1 Tax=Psychrobacillus sp. NPDC096623 TaxID=3364492 RepID=UPI0038070861